MKQKTGKKIGKILLLVILAAVVGVIVYTALTWPVYPRPSETGGELSADEADGGGPGRAGAAGGCASLDPARV